MVNLKSFSMFAIILLFYFSNTLAEENAAGSVANIDEKTVKEINEIKKLKRKTKLTACVSIVKNNLDQDNDKVKKLLVSTSDKSATYDFILIKLIANCMSVITDDQIDKILDPDNIFKVLPEEEKLLFNLNFTVSNLVYSPEMDEILNDLKEAISSEQTENIVNVEEEIGLFGIKLNQPGYLQYSFLLIGIILFLVIVCGGFWYLFSSSKNKKDKKKKKKGDKEDKED